MPPATRWHNWTEGRRGNRELERHHGASGIKNTINRCKISGSNEEHTHTHDLLNWWREIIWRNPASFHDKNVQQTRNRGKLSQHNKNCMLTTTANIIPNGERQRVFPLTQAGEKDVCFYHFCPAQYWKSQPVQSGMKNKRKHQIWKRGRKIISADIESKTVKI